MQTGLAAHVVSEARQLVEDHYQEIVDIFRIGPGSVMNEMSRMVGDSVKGVA